MPAIGGKWVASEGGGGGGKGRETAGSEKLFGLLNATIIPRLFNSASIQAVVFFF